MSSCVVDLFVFRMPIALWKMADRFPSQKVLLCLVGWFVGFLWSVLMSFDISTLIINGTRFSGVLGALWVHLCSLGVMANTRPEIRLVLGILNMINRLFDCSTWTLVGKVTCKEPEGEIATHWLPSEHVGGRVEGWAWGRGLVTVQIPWPHLEDSDLVPLGGTQVYVFVNSALDD